MPRQREPRLRGLMSGRSERLRSLIAEEIRQQGPISFERFMERALYEPGLGYYALSGAAQPAVREEADAAQPEARGPGVDFCTSPGVGAVFARLLAVQVEECWRRLGAPDDFVLAEFGAGALALAATLRGALERAGAWPASGRYLAVDPHVSPETGAPGIERATEEEGLEALRNSPAFVLSNELLDALPVRRFVIRSGRPLEVRVGLGENGSAAGDVPRFIEVEAEAAGEELCAALRGAPALSEGFQFEINLRARAWMGRVARALRRGYVLTLDYGYRRTERFRPERAAGTCQAYRRHRIESDLLANPGAQDLTSHVDFDDLIDAGAAAGLELAGLCDQMRFLTALARRAGILEGEPATPEGWSERLAFKDLIRPGGMGSAFRVLVQARGVGGKPAAEPLAGLIDPFAVQRPREPPAVARSRWRGVS